MKILIVVDMQKDFISGPLGTAEARAIVPYVAEKAKNTPRENLFVTLDTHQPNYMETNEGRHLPVPHCIEGTEGHALDNAIAAAVDQAVHRDAVMRRITRLLVIAPTDPGILDFGNTVFRDLTCLNLLAQIGRHVLDQAAAHAPRAAGTADGN